MNDTNIDVQNGYNQIAPNATNQIQNFYGFDFAEKLLKTKECPLTLVVLGSWSGCHVRIVNILQPCSSNRGIFGER